MTGVADLARAAGLALGLLLASTAGLQADGSQGAVAKRKAARPRRMQDSTIDRLLD